MTTTHPDIESKSETSGNWPLWITGLLACILATPIFFTTNQGQFALAGPERGSNLGGATGIPISTLTLPLIGLLGLVRYGIACRKRGFSYIRIADLLAFAYAILILVAIGYRIKQDGQIQTVNLRFAIQSMLPLTAFAYARSIATPTQIIRHIHLFFNVWALTFLTWLVFFVAQTIIDGESKCLHNSITNAFGPFYNTKAQQMFPMGLAIAAIIFACQLIAYAKQKTHFLQLSLPLLATTVLVSALCLCHSRTPLLTFGLFATIAILYMVVQRQWRSLGATSICMALTASAITGLIQINPELVRDRSLNRTTYTLLHVKLVPGPAPLAHLFKNETQSTSADITSDATPETMPDVPTDESPQDSDETLQTSGSQTPSATQTPSKPRVNSYDKRRLARQKEAARVTFSHWLGSAFYTAAYQRTRFQRFEDGIQDPSAVDAKGYRWVHGAMRTYPSENGFLDIGVRTGPISLVCVLSVAGISLWHLWQWHTTSIANTAIRLALSGFLGVGVLFGANWFHLLTEPFLSPVIWLTFGFTNGLPANAKHKSDQNVE